MNRLQVSCGLVATIAMILASAPAIAGDLTGRVVDADTGRPLPGAEVVIEGTGRSAVTDRAGEFRIVDAPSGLARVTASSVGYADGSADLQVPGTGTVGTEIRLPSLARAEVMDEIVVTGFRIAQLTALQDKRSSVQIKDSVTADDAGKLPDINAAEALQRLPGTSISIDQGEGRYVSIRGIDAGLNNVTIDGQTIGAPEADSRRIALDTIPTDVLSKLEVVKAVTPDMDANAVGGTVNLVTPSAYDPAQPTQLTASVNAGYYDINGKTPYGGSATWSQRFGADEQFGLVLAGSYSERQYDSENVQGGAEWEEEGDYVVPDEFVLRDYELERIRQGIVANLEFRPTDQVRLYWRNLWNEFQDTEQRQAAIIDYRNGDLLDQTPTSGTFTEAEADRRVKYRREKQSILNTSLGGEFLFGRYTLSADLAYGEAKQDTPFDNEWRFSTADEFPATYDTSRFFWNVDGGAPFYDASGYDFDEVSRNRQLVEEKLKIAQLDLKREFDFGSGLGYWKVGAKLTDRDKDSDQDGNVYDGFDGDYLLDSVSKPGKKGFLTSVASYYNPYGPRVDYRAAEAVFAVSTSSFERSDLDSLEESLAADYQVSEEIVAAYVMAGFDSGPWSLTGGVRMEKTDASYGAYDLVFEDGDLVEESVFRKGSNNYTDYLPGLIVRYQAAPDLFVRAAWTNTLGRPAYDRLVPLREFEIDPDGDGAFEGGVTEGNPDLDPLRSMNFDLALEWYLRPAGLVSVGLFYKDIEDPIYTSVMELEDTDYEGRFFSELSIERPENAPSGRILGVELDWQQQFTSLAAPFDGFGVGINYTWTDGEAKVFGRDGKVPFFLQPEHVGNFAIFYEKYGFEARLALAYRSEYLDEVAGDAEQDIYVDARSQLDLKLSYMIAEQWKAFVEFRNLTDEPWRYLNGNKRLAENEIYGWNASAGLQVRF